eukprot:TRINITY_DN67632_c7_g13_i1.p1 TRINITY_DN67632_c7_g13~~TRINITY_DN67632_c7_g13_i1.p1  ORF type:complete len:700 (+),score=59.02 TRINITY_DN67632_c7_g13_i1:74-2173(+)
MYQSTYVLILSICIALTVPDVAAVTVKSCKTNIPNASCATLSDGNTGTLLTTGRLDGNVNPSATLIFDKAYEITTLKFHQPSVNAKECGTNGEIPPWSIRTLINTTRVDPYAGGWGDNDDWGGAGAGYLLLSNRVNVNLEGNEVTTYQFSPPIRTNMLHFSWWSWALSCGAVTEISVAEIELVGTPLQCQFTELVSNNDYSALTWGGRTTDLRDIPNDPKRYGANKKVLAVGWLDDPQDCSTYCAAQPQQNIRNAAARNEQGAVNGFVWENKTHPVCFCLRDSYPKADNTVQNVQAGWGLHCTVPLVTMSGINEDLSGTPLWTVGAGVRQVRRPLVGFTKPSHTHVIAVSGFHAGTPSMAIRMRASAFFLTAPDRAEMEFSTWVDSKVKNVAYHHLQIDPQLAVATGLIIAEVYDVLYTGFGGRSKSFNIDYSAAGFTTPPNVWLAMTQYDGRQDMNRRFSYSLASKTNTGATVTVSTWADSAVWSTKISWIAYDTSSGFQSGDSGLSLADWRTGVSTGDHRCVSVTFPTPFETAPSQVALTIKAFDYAGAGTAIDTTVDATSITTTEFSWCAKVEQGAHLYWLRVSWIAHGTLVGGSFLSETTTEELDLQEASLIEGENQAVRNAADVGGKATNSPLRFSFVAGLLCGVVAAAALATIAFLVMKFRTNPETTVRRHNSAIMDNAANQARGSIEKQDVV